MVATKSLACTCCAAYSAATIEAEIEGERVKEKEGGESFTVKH